LEEIFCHFNHNYPAVLSTERNSVEGYNLTIWNDDGVSNYGSDDRGENWVMRKKEIK
jgi:hypothetical protein